MLVRPVLLGRFVLMEFKLHAWPERTNLLPVKVHVAVVMLDTFALSEPLLKLFVRILHTPLVEQVAAQHALLEISAGGV